MVGNLPNFTKIDVLRCLLKIEKPVSRSKLSKILELGEGTVRSILDILKGNKLLVSNKKGHFLSDKGNSVVKKIKCYIDIDKVSLDSINKDKKKVAVHVKNIKKLEKAYELRDTAVKAGADGALILDYDKGLKLSEWTDPDYSADFKKIENKFDLNENDLVVIAYAGSYKLAEYGALAAAVDLNNDLNSLMQKFT